MALPSNPKPKSFIMLSTNRAKDLETLEDKITPIVNHYFEKGIYDIHVRLYVCKYRNRYIYVSKVMTFGIEKSSNRPIEIHAGSNKLVEYAVAYWKYDHARAKDIKWNTLILHSDGYELSQPSTDLDENVEKRALSDARDGIMLKIGRAITRVLYKTFIGSWDPTTFKKKSKSDDDDMDLITLK